MTNREVTVVGIIIIILAIVTILRWVVCGIFGDAWTGLAGWGGG